MKWLVLGVAIWGIGSTEKLIRRFIIRIEIALSVRIQYPIWLLVALDNFVDVSWLIGLYGAAIGLVAIRAAKFLALKAELLQDGIQLIAEIKKAQRFTEKVAREIDLLQLYGCPLGLSCEQMGKYGKRCSNFYNCQALLGDYRND